MSPKKTASRTYPDLITWREANGLNQRDAAKMLGISQTRYSRLERRARTATGDLAKHIIEVTRVPLETIVGVA